MKSEEEIQEEIEKLKDIEGRVRPYSAFGDSNVGAVSAQIKVLERGLDDEDDVYDMFDHDEYLLDAALNALYWAQESPNYEEEGPPSDGWLPLCRED